MKGVPRRKRKQTQKADRKYKSMIKKKKITTTSPNKDWSESLSIKNSTHITGLKKCMTSKCNILFPCRLTTVRR